MVVEKLLKLLVDKVDGDLLKAVVLKDLKTSNVEHSTEVGLFLRRKKVDFIFDCDLNTDHIKECPSVNSPWWGRPRSRYIYQSAI